MRYREINPIDTPIIEHKSIKIIAFFLPIYAKLPPIKDPINPVNGTKEAEIEIASL